MHIYVTKIGSEIMLFKDYFICNSINEVEKPVDWYSVLNTTLAAKALRYGNEKLGLLSDMTVQQVTD